MVSKFYEFAIGILANSLILIANYLIFQVKTVQPRKKEIRQLQKFLKRTFKPKTLQRGAFKPLSMVEDFMVILWLKSLGFKFGVETFMVEVLYNLHVLLF